LADGSTYPVQESSVIDEDYNYIIDLCQEFSLDIPAERCLVVKNLKGKMYDFELIFRRHIGGSVFKAYQETGKAGGYDLPSGLPQWSKLDRAVFTPSTKEELDHDINVDAEYFFKKMKEAGQYDEAVSVVDMLEEAYCQAYDYAKQCGLLILDTKFEVAGDVIGDEIITPDSSRFTKESDWFKTMAAGKSPVFLDKQPVRDWGLKIVTPFFDSNGNQIVGINKLQPKNPEHVQFIHSLVVPEEVISDTTKRYLEIVRLITKENLDYYQHEAMGLWLLEAC
jgi:phosphoribosylaminoimidazole-succinocarboxamide synthase